MDFALISLNSFKLLHKILSRITGFVEAGDFHSTPIFFSHIWWRSACILFCSYRDKILSFIADPQVTACQTSTETLNKTSCISNLKTCSLQNHALQTVSQILPCGAGHTHLEVFITAAENHDLWQYWDYRCFSSLQFI